MKKLVVLISGGGSNLQAIIDAIQRGDLDAEIVLVVANRKGAYGLERAQAAGLVTAYHPFKPYREAGRQREDYDRDLAALLQPYAPDLVVLAGWMHILGIDFLEAFPQRVINLHPALPGQFPGVNAIERAFQAWQRGEIDHSGVMVHHAIPRVDAGAVILQEAIPFETGDTLASYAAKVHAVEHRLLVEAIRRL